MSSIRDDWPRYRVFYRLKTDNAITNWKEAIFKLDVGIDPPPVAHVSAPHTPARPGSSKHLGKLDGMLTAIHWGLSKHISKYFESLLSETTELYDLYFRLEEPPKPEIPWEETRSKFVGLLRHEVDELIQEEIEADADQPSIWCRR